MKYCRFCGKELVEDQCDCLEFRRANAPEGGKRRLFRDPLLIPSFKVNVKSVSGFISSIRDLSGMSEASSSAGDPFEYNVPIVPDCIEPEKDEVVVKQYNIARLRTRLKFMKAEGRLMVTTHRLLFRAAGTSLTGNLLQEHQYKLDDISGVELHKDYKFSLMNLLGSLLLLVLGYFLIGRQIMPEKINGFTTFMCVLTGLLGMVPTFVVYKRFWLKLLCAFLSVTLLSAIAYTGWFAELLMYLALIIFAMNMIIVCFVPNLVIKIKASGGGDALVVGSQKTIFSRQTGDDYSGFTEVMPWEDTVMAINELGTIIDDLKNHSDHAVDKWTQQ